MHSPEPPEREPDHTATIPAGRIVHDERGNAMWKWRGDDDDASNEASGILKYVDPADLAVEGGKPGGTGGGYDPYNQGKPKSRGK